MGIKERGIFFYNSVSPLSRGLFMVYSMLAGLTWLRDELLGEKYKEYHIINLIPAWPSYVWVATGILLLAIVLIEGAFRQHFIAAEAHSGARPLIDLSGNPYRSVKRNGLSRLIGPIVILLVLVSAYYLNKPTTEEGVSHRVNSGGLNFQEVPAQEMGIPRTFLVDMGGNRVEILYENLQSQVPFGQMFGFRVSGEIPLSIHFSKTGEMLINTDIYKSRNYLAASIRDNKFTVVAPEWDRNWDASALEIINEKNEVVFQIDRIRENFLKIRGWFITSIGSTYVSTDKGVFTGARTKEAPLIKPLFKYPSSKYANQRLDP